MIPSEPENLFSTWTRFQVPENQEILIIRKKHSDGYFEVTGAWKGLFFPLVKAPGQMEISVGRIKESRKDVVLLIQWESRNHYENFRASSAYQEYWSKLDQYSMPKHDPLELSLVSDFWLGTRSRAPGLAVITCYFSSSVPQEIKDEIQQMHGFRQWGYWGPGLDHLNKMKQQRRAWVVDSHPQAEYCAPNSMKMTTLRSGRVVTQRSKVNKKDEVPIRSVDTLLWFCNYYSPEKEASFKEFGSISTLDYEPPEGGTLMDDFDVRIRRWGAMSWKEEHIEFFRINDYSVLG